MSCLYILEINPLSVTLFAIIPSVFHLLWIPTLSPPAPTAIPFLYSFLHQNSWKSSQFSLSPILSPLILPPTHSIQDLSQVTTVNSSTLPNPAVDSQSCLPGDQVPLESEEVSLVTWDQQVLVLPDFHTPISVLPARTIWFHWPQVLPVNYFVSYTAGSVFLMAHRPVCMQTVISILTRHSPSRKYAHRHGEFSSKRLWEAQLSGGSCSSSGDRIKAELPCGMAQGERRMMGGRWIITIHPSDKQNKNLRGLDTFRFSAFGIENNLKMKTGRFSSQELSFFFLFFGPAACGILVSWQRVEPEPSAVEARVSTTGPQVKSWLYPLKAFIKQNSSSPTGPTSQSHSLSPSLPP